MAKIPLNVTKKYRPSWGYFQGVRELLQNARDGEEFDGYKMSVEHFPRTNKLVISNAGVAIDPALLLLFGESSKGDGLQRGKFGEGFNMGCLALTRAGHGLTIYNGEEVWRTGFEAMDDPGNLFYGHEVFTILTRKLQNARQDFTVEIDNVTKDIWEATKPCFLFLSPPKASEVVALESGTVLLGEAFKGRIYHRDIYVPLSDLAARELDLECGYDVKHLELGPDRDIVNAWTLRAQLSRLWKEANEADPEKFAPRLYNMLKDGRSETKSIPYLADEKLLSALRNEFLKEHGDNTIPVASMQDSRELAALGAQTTLVNRTLHELLEKAGPTVAAVRKTLEGTIRARHGWETLTDSEKQTYQTWLARLSPESLVVDFADPATVCRYVEEEGVVAVSREALSGPVRELLRHVALQEARRCEVEPLEVLLNVLCSAE